MTTDFPISSRKEVEEMALKEPPRKDGRLREERVIVCLTDEEAERLHRLAAYTNASLGEVFRRILDREWRLRERYVVAVERAKRSGHVKPF